MALISVVALLIICNSHYGLGNEYMETYEYCSDHLDASANEKENYRRVTSGNYGHSEYIEKDKFESIQECFRYTYFNINRTENLTINISASTKTIDSKLRSVDPKVSKLVLHIEPVPTKDPRVRQDLNITVLGAFKQLRELWIVQTKNDNVQYKQRYTLQYYANNTDNFPVENLHVNNMNIRFAVPLDFFIRFPNLGLLDLDGSSFNEGCVTRPTLVAGINGQPCFCYILSQLIESPLNVLSLANIQNQIWYPSASIIVAHWRKTMALFPELMYLNISNNELTSEFFFLLDNINNLTMYDVSNNGLRKEYQFDLFLYVMTKHVQIFNLGPLTFDSLDETPFSASRKKFCAHIDKNALDITNIFSDFLFKGQRGICLSVACTDIFNLPELMYAWCMKQNIGNILKMDCPSMARLPSSGPIIELGLQRFIEIGDWAEAKTRSTCLIESKVRNFDFSYNAIGTSYSLNFMINHLELFITDSDMEIFDLGGNGIRFENFDLLKSFRRLKKLILSGNDISSATLSQLCEQHPELETLLMSDGNLHTIHKDTFIRCHKLKFLDLSRSHLIDLGVHSMPSLQFLNLSNNQISTLSEDFFSLMKHKRNEQLIVDLSNNKLDCTCYHKTLSTVEGIRDAFSHFLYYESLTCVDSEGYMFIHEVDTEEIRKRCFPSHWHTIVFSILTGIVSILLTVLAYTIYWKRYHIKTWIYKLKYHTLIGKDCYVLHCNQDLAWVYYCLQRKLEGQFNFNLVIPARDLIGQNQFEIDDIISGMERARVILIIMSEQLLKDPKCLFDVNYAFDLRRRTGKPLVFIKLGQISDQSAGVDPKIKEVLAARGYIKWPAIMNEDYSDTHVNKHERQEDIFWQKVASKVYDNMASLRNLNTGDHERDFLLLSSQLSEVGLEEGEEGEMDV